MLIPIALSISIPTSSLVLNPDKDIASAYSISFHFTSFHFTSTQLNSTQLGLPLVRRGEGNGNGNGNGNGYDNCNGTGIADESENENENENDNRDGNRDRIEVPDETIRQKGFDGMVIRERAFI